MSTPDYRKMITTTFAGWTVLSVFRRGPICSREDIYPLLDKVNFDQLFIRDGEVVTSDEFSGWHRKTTLGIQKARPELCVGWAAKLINVYLKTAAYVGDLGRPGLRAVLHPPIDSGLRDGIKRWASEAGLTDKDKKALLEKTHATDTIAAIRHYDKDYMKIIEGCREVAAKVPCLLIEVEHLWEGASVPSTQRPV